MFTNLKRRIYRDRRRLGFTFLCYGAYGAAVAMDDPLNLLKMLFVGVIFGAIMTTGLFVLSLILPKWRPLLEISSGLGLVIGAMGWIAPGTMDGLSDTNRAILIILVCMGLGNLYGGPLLDRLTMRKNVRATARARTRLSPDEVWLGLYGLPEHHAALHNANKVLTYEAVADLPDTYRIVEKADAVTQIEELQTIELRDPPNAIRFAWRVPSADQDTPFSRGVHEAILTPTKSGGTEIAVTYTVADYAGRMALYAWMDDHFGRVTDDKLMALEARARANEASPTQSQARVA